MARGGRQVEIRSSKFRLGGAETRPEGQAVPSSSKKPSRAGAARRRLQEAEPEPVPDDSARDEFVFSRASLSVAVGGLITRGRMISCPTTPSWYFKAVWTIPTITAKWYTKLMATPSIARPSLFGSD